MVVGATVMSQPVVSAVEASSGQSHGVELMKDGAVVPCGGSVQQGDALTIKKGWGENAPEYLLEVTSGGISSDGARCEGTRIVDHSGDISLTASTAGEFTIRALYSYNGARTYAVNECAFTVNPTAGMEQETPDPETEEPETQVPAPEASDAAPDQVCFTNGLCVESSIVHATGTMTTTITSDNDAWFSIGFSKTGGRFMSGDGDGADMIICSEEGLRRFWVKGHDNPENYDETTATLSQEAATAAGEENSCVFENGRGKMTFTRSLAANGDMEREVVVGTPQVVIWARGDGERELSSVHSSRGMVEMDLTDLSAGVTELKLKGQWTLWIHLLMMAPAWGMLLPLGVAMANRLKLVDGAPEGAWFKVHRTVQVIGWLLQLIGFVFALVHSSKYSKHMSHPHSILGLAIVIIGTLQPLNAALRPHPPQGGWPNGQKPTGRVAFEAVHKGLGWAAVVLGMLNVILGAMLARKLDYEASVWAVPLTIGCIGISMFLVYFGLGVVSPNNAINRTLTGARPGVQHNPELEKGKLVGQGELSGVAPGPASVPAA